MKNYDRLDFGTKMGRLTFIVVFCVQFSVLVINFYLILGICANINGDLLKLKRVKSGVNLE